jgi:membrane protease YdiL (CAAX protease family)
MDSRPEALTPRAQAKLIAPLWHSLGLLIILLAISWGLLRMQSRSLAAGEQHHGNVMVYISVIASEWAMTLYVGLGGLIPGTMRLRDLVGGRWSNRREVSRDIALAIALWIAATGVGILGGLTLRPHVEPLAFLSPRGVAEVVLWVVMSVTAGFCEKLVYRGYLQKQFLALTGNVAVAVLAQGVLFGVGHWYQGLKMVIIIALLGVLFGAFTYWRKSLRPGMIAHAFGDVANLIA